MLTAILAGLAAGLSLATIYVQATAYDELEREVRLAQLQLDNMKIAMLVAGIDPSPHLEGESP
jgi:hypothetical protein